jgi:hypothetical protein
VAARQRQQQQKPPQQQADLPLVSVLDVNVLAARLKISPRCCCVGNVLLV